MKLTVNIKEQSKVAAFLKLINDIDYIEVVSIKDDDIELSEEHKRLLDQRLRRIENGETTFLAWEEIKQKYEKKGL